MTMTTPTATIVDNRTGDATSIDARVFGALKAFLQALGATYADEEEADVCPTNGPGGADHRNLSTNDRAADELREVQGFAYGGGRRCVTLSDLMGSDRRFREGWSATLDEMREVAAFACRGFHTAISQQH